MVERGSRLRPHVPEEPVFILSTAVTAKVFSFAVEVENMVRHVPICLRIINLEKRIQVFLIKKSPATRSRHPQATYLIKACWICGLEFAGVFWSVWEKYLRFCIMVPALKREEKEEEGKGNLQ